MATTTNYSWVTPDDSDPFKQGASAIRTLGSSVDTTVYGLGQGVKSYVRSTAVITVPATTETVLMTSTSFTPVAGRLYELTYTIGRLTKTTGAGTITVRLRKDTVTGSILDTSTLTIVVNAFEGLSKSILLTTTQMGTTAFSPTITVAATTNGYIANNNLGDTGAIIVKDIGAA